MFNSSRIEVASCTRDVAQEQTLLLGATWNFQAGMIYEEASTSPLVDPRRIRETYILILVTGAQRQERYDDPNDVFRIVFVPLHTGCVEDKKKNEMFQFEALRFREKIDFCILCQV